MLVAPWGMSGGIPGQAFRIAHGAGTSISSCLLFCQTRLFIMIDPAHPIAKLLKEDRRYKLDAYAFVFEALNYAHNVLGMGAERPAESEEDEPDEGGTREAERHLTGQQLCEAIRRYALEQYGYMAQDVLRSWGLSSTSTSARSCST